MKSPSSERTEAFIQLLTEHERMLTLYVNGLINSPQDAQDVLQEGKMVMWRSFQNFQLGTNFLAWGRRILLHKILDYRKRKKREGAVLLHDETFKAVEAEISSHEREKYWIEREQQLQLCITKLPLEHQEILKLRYNEGASSEHLALHTGKSITAIYKLLSRLRQTLSDCVTHALTSHNTKHQEL